MNKETLSIILWLAAGLLFVLLIVRRRRRKMIR
jgi:hypothetical protein